MLNGTDPGSDEFLGEDDIGAAAGAVMADHMEVVENVGVDKYALARMKQQLGYVRLILIVYVGKLKTEKL